MDAVIEEEEKSCYILMNTKKSSNLKYITLYHQERYYREQIEEE